MTKLEAELKQSLIDNRFETIGKQIDGLAEVAKKYIEEAYDAGWKAINDAPYWSLDKEREEWLKENGVIE